MVPRALAVIRKPAVVPCKAKKTSYSSLIFLFVFAVLLIGFFSVKGLKFFPFSLIAISSTTVYDILLAFTAVDFLYFLARYEGFLSFLSFVDTIECFLVPVVSTLANVTNVSPFVNTFACVVNREVLIVDTAFSSFFYLIFSFFGGGFDFIYGVLKDFGAVIAQPTFPKVVSFFDKYVYSYVRWLNPWNLFRIWGFRAFLQEQLVDFLPFVNSFLKGYLGGVLQLFTYPLEVATYLYSATVIPVFYWFVTVFFPFFTGLEASFLFLLKFKNISLDAGVAITPIFQSVLLPFFLLYCFFLNSLLFVGFLLYTVFTVYCPLLFSAGHTLFSTILNFFNLLHSGLVSGLWCFYHSQLYFGFFLLPLIVICLLLFGVFLGVLFVTFLRISSTFILVCSLIPVGSKVFFTYAQLSVTFWSNFTRLFLSTISTRLRLLCSGLREAGLSFSVVSSKINSNLVPLFTTILSSLHSYLIYLKFYSLFLLASTLFQLVNPLPFIKLFWDGLSFYIMSFSPSLLFLQDLLEVNPDQEDGVLEWDLRSVNLEDVAREIAKFPPFSGKSAIAAKFEYFNYALWLMDSYKLFFLWFLIVVFLVLLMHRYSHFDVNLALGCVGLVFLFNLVTTYGLTLFYTTICSLSLLYSKHSSIVVTDLEGVPYYFTLSSFIFYTMEMEAIDDIYDVTPWLQDDICDVYEEYRRKKKFVRFMVPVWRFLIEESGSIK